MAIQWTEALAVGNKKIDSQHQELFDRINQLLEACNKGKGKEQIGNIVNFLEEYVVVHFRMEEELMLQYCYPEYAEHKMAHDRFVTKFSELKKRIDTEGTGTNIVILTNRVVVDWLNNHILKVDKKLGVFLAEN